MAARPPDMSDWYTRQGLQVKGGGITMQTGGAIRAGQSTYNSGSGFFMGWETGFNAGGVPLFSIGDGLTHFLTWDGTSLSISGNINLLPGSTILWSAITGSGKPADFADVTLTAVNGGLAVTGGGITLSGGGSIKGGQTAYNTGTGFFLGYDTGGTPGYKFSVGTSSGDFMVWNGSNLVIGGTVTSYQFNGQGTFTAVVPTSPALNIIGPLSGSVAALTVAATGSRNAISVSVGTGYALTTVGDVSCTNVDTTKINFNNATGGSSLYAGNGATAHSYQATMQNDGNFVIYHGAVPYWDATSDLSDATLKQNIIDTPHNGIDQIMQLRVVDYEWKPDVFPTGTDLGYRTGFLAQEVLPVVPEAVREINGYYLLHKEELVPLIVKAIQNNKQRMDAMSNYLTFLGDYIDNVAAFVKYGPKPVKPPKP